MIKILFICHGNICRSPMAEFMFKDKIAKANLSNKIHIESAATTDDEIYHGVGNPVYPPARKILADHGISCDGKRARQIVKEDYNKFDYLICMDAENIRHMRHLWPQDPEHKIYKMLSFANLDRDVADPWFTRDFQATWDDLELGCNGLLTKIQNDLQF